MRRAYAAECTAILWVTWLALWAGGANARAAVDQPLRISANGRYLIDRSGRPFLLQGDAAWSLIANLTDADAALYLKDRHAKGFSAVLVNLLEYRYAKYAPKNVYGVAPFADMQDWSKPNESYFRHADWVIRKAAENGIVVLLAPIYLGYPGAGEGFYREVLANGPERMLEYGEFLGRHYRHFDNIIWVMGGDRNPGPAREDADMVAYGIREFDRRHLFTAHVRAESPPVEEFPGSWLDIESTYSGSIVHRFLSEDYDRVPIKPFFLIESSYEGEHDSSPVQIRRQAYWSVLSGGFGHVFGNRPIWKFAPGWQQALNRTGSTDMMHWGRFFRSIPWFDLVPDQKHEIVTAGLGEFNGLDYLTAARTRDRREIVAYVSTARTITVDLSKVAGPTVEVTWMNPRTGTSQAAGQVAATGMCRFTPPGEGDWILRLDSRGRQDQ